MAAAVPPSTSEGWIPTHISVHDEIQISNDLKHVQTRNNTAKSRKHYVGIYTYVPMYMYDVDTHTYI